MKHRAFEVLAIVASACLSVFCATATAATANKVQIVDPSVLQSMGLPANATDVYQSLNVGKDGSDGVQFNSDFGLVVRYTGIAPKAFIGRQNIAGSWQYDGGSAGCCQNLSARGTEAFADAPIYLPDGVAVSGLRWWATDSNAAQDLAFFVFETCLPAFGAGPSVNTVLASTATSGSSGDQSAFFSFSTTIDNQSCIYTARVRFDATSGLTLQKIRFQWARQITPAPGVATFTDVPIGHPFFQEVQALFGSGITNGCTPTTFCPQDPVTRGQMAAFLSRALGL